MKVKAGVCSSPGEGVLLPSYKKRENPPKGG